MALMAATSTIWVAMSGIRSLPLSWPMRWKSKLLLGLRHDAVSVIDEVLEQL
jgi:hypothetical protein